MTKITFLALLCGLYGCSAVTVMTDAKPKNRAAPSFEKRFNYYWWGLKGEHKVNVREICRNDKTEQVQAVKTLSDTLLYTVTLGIYAPRTARVWCGERNDV